MSNDSVRKYSNEQHQNIPRERILPEPPVASSSNILNRSILERVLNESNYEMFGFVYKIKAYEFTKSNSKDLNNLKRIELICKDPTSQLSDVIGRDTQFD